MDILNAQMLQGFQMAHGAKFEGRKAVALLASRLGQCLSADDSGAI